VVVLQAPGRRRGALVGLTGNYVEVVFDGPAALARALVRVRVLAVDGERTLGEVA
jgi:hypothetical protein